LDEGLSNADEPRSRDLNVPLTPHEKAIERAKVLAHRVDSILDSFRREGQLKAFNRCYQLHRRRVNGHARPYSYVLNQLRAEVIRVLVERPPDQLQVTLLTQRLRERFPWYVWYA
jgi:hypothetical protein